MEFHAKQIAAPKYWEEFEDLCLDLFRRVWGDPTAQKNGRRGQPQNGTDICGRLTSGEVCGLQCKGKDSRLGAAVTEKELREEAEKAKSFQPRLSRWLLVTTGSKDGAIEATARLISEEHKDKGLFSVQVLAWEDLQSMISDYPEVMEKYYRDQAPATREMRENLAALLKRGDSRELQPELQTVQAGISDIRTQVNFLAAAISKDASLGTLSDPFDIALQARIDEARDLLKAGQPRTALKMLRRLTEQNWQSATARARFRILSNRASAHLDLAENDEAADLFLEAASYAPDDPKAKTNSALAHLLRNDKAAARVAAAAALEENAANGDASAILILSSTDRDEVRDPLSLVPAGQPPAPNVLHAAAHWYRQRGNPSMCQTLLKRAHELDPEDVRVSADLANALLEPIFQNEAALYGRKLATDQRSDLERAVNLLTRVWSRALSSEVPEEHVLQASNLATALRFSGKLDDAEARLDEALRVAPRDPFLLQHKARILVIRDRYSEALTILQGISSDDPEVAILHADTLALAGRPAEALRVLDEIGDGQDTRVRSRIIPDRIRLLCLIGQLEKAQLVAEQLVADHPSDPVGYLALADVYRRQRDPEQARDVARRGIALATPNDCLVRVLLADTLYALEDWDGAADALLPIVGTDEDSHVLQRFIFALIRADRRVQAIAVLSSLPAAIADLPTFRRAAAIPHERVGNLAEARQHLERYLDQVQNDLPMRLLWLEVVENLGDRKALDSFLDGVFDLSDADVRSRMALAHVLDKHGRGASALNVGYETLREHWADPQAHLGYTGLFLLGGSVGAAIPTMESVQVDAAFTVKSDDGKVTSYVIEGRFAPNPIHGEISPASPLAMRASGLSVGALVQIHEHALLSEQHRIAEVKHKYLHLFHRSLAEFNRLFPAEHGLLGFRMDPKEPSEALERMRTVLESRRKHVEDILGAYRNGGVPIGMLARYTRDEAIDAWYGLMELEATIDVCAGTTPERNQALKVLSSQAQVVLDPLTFWIAGTLRVLDALRQTLGSLGITQSGVDMLQRCAAERERLAGKEALSLSERDGQLYRVVVSPEQTQSSFELSSSLLAWARTKAVIVPAVATKELPRDIREIADCMDPAFMDTVLAASGPGRVLLSEDRRLRALAAEAVSVRGAWLQIALIAALKAEKLNRDQYSRAIADLALAGHDFTAIDSQILVHVAKRNSWNSVGQFARLARVLGGPQVDMNSSISVAGEFLRWLWAYAPAGADKEKFTAALFDGILTNHKQNAGDIIGRLAQIGKPKQARSLESRIRALRGFRDGVARWRARNSELFA